MATKTELLRQALAKYGPSSAKELSRITGFGINNVCSLMSWGIKHGKIFVRKSDGERNVYGLPEIKSRPAPVLPAFLNKLSPDSFLTLAEKARYLEQRNYFTDAAPYWLAAADFARKGVNQDWCRSRADFCSRGWKYTGVEL